jgi:hypothetical protein
MRVAEMLAERTATRLLATMEPELAGPTNSGAIQLAGNRRLIRDAFAALERVCREYRAEDLDDDVAPPA